MGIVGFPFERQVQVEGISVLVPLKMGYPVNMDGSGLLPSHAKLLLDVFAQGARVYLASQKFDETFISVDPAKSDCAYYIYTTTANGNDGSTIGEISIRLQVELLPAQQSGGMRVHACEVTVPKRKDLDFKAKFTHQPTPSKRPALPQGSKARSRAMPFC